MSTLILIRHGESEWNDKGLFTGWVDVRLSERGRTEAARAGQQLRRQQRIARVARLRQRVVVG